MEFEASVEDMPRSFVPVKVVWVTVFVHVLIHIGGVIGMFLATTSAMWKTIFYAIVIYIMSMIGITAGAHRLWSHRTYKAKLPLRILLAFFNTMALQYDIFWWSRDHRLHHKFTETNADPYSIKRGFFFSHMGWTMVKKHPDAIEKGKTIDMSDLLADPVVVFQRKYYSLLAVICCFVLPPAIPLLWGENIFISVFVTVALRLFFSMHATYSVNSFAHLIGNRPYTEHTEARENMAVNFWVLGEGFHNYHHAFPWDYSASEFGAYFSLATTFINLMAWCGLAYDLKTVPSEVISKRKQKLRGGSLREAKSQTYKYN